MGVPTTDAARWLGIGRGADGDPRLAGAAATAQALAGRTDAKLLLAFLGAGVPAEQVLAGIAEQAPGVPLVGATTYGQLAAGGPADDLALVVALGGDGFVASTVAVPDAARDLRRAGAEVAACVGDVADKPHRVLVVLADSVVDDHMDVLRGAYSVAGAGIPVVGGCVPDAAAGGAELHDGEVLRGAIVGAAIGSDAPFGIGTRHGLRAGGEPMLVTRAAGCDVLELDGRPALDVYLERVGADEALAHDTERFLEFALERPLGLRSRAAEEHVRGVVGLDPERRTVRLTSVVRSGALVWVLDVERDALLGAAAEATTAALGGLGDLAPLGLIAFGCAGRRPLLGEDGTRAEVAGLAAAAPLAGGYVNGELSRTRGLAGYHNQALVLLAIA